MNFGYSTSLTSTNVLTTKVFPFTLTYVMTAATTGLNGLDTGSLQANRQYFLFAIVNQGAETIGCLLSLSENSPTLPTGYVISYLISLWFTDGSANLVNAYTIDNTFFYGQPQTVFSGGNSTVFASEDISVLIGTVHYCSVLLECHLNPNAAGNLATFRPTGDVGTGMAHANAAVAGVSQYSDVWVVAKAGSFDYKVSSAMDSLDVKVRGFQF